MIDLSLIVPYRDRARNLRALLAWYAQRRRQQCAHTLELILIESSPAPTARQLAGDLPGVIYLHDVADGIFAKARLLNLGLRAASAGLVTPYDVDLLPVGETLDRHIAHAQAAKGSLCLTGYRLMCSRSHVSPEEIDAVARRASSPQEETVTYFVRRQLLDGWRFGVVPLFDSERLRRIGGWDERFVGWGAEDQDVLERYLQPDLILARSTDLLYLHLHHPRSKHWNGKQHAARNRALYGQKTGQRRRVGG